MRELETTLTRKGQVTIPVEIRQVLGLKPKDRVAFELEGGAVRIRRASSRVERWYGTVTPRERPEDFRKIREQFEQAVADETIRRG